MEKWQFSIEDIENGNIAFAWENYAKAMSKRRPDSVLPYERFENYVLGAGTLGLSISFWTAPCHYRTDEQRCFLS